jgi:hypothetical protein
MNELIKRANKPGGSGYGSKTKLLQVFLAGLFTPLIDHVNEKYGDQVKDKKSGLKRDLNRECNTLKRRKQILKRKISKY